MSAPRGLVLLATAVVASPVAGLLLDGHLDYEAAAVRVGICLVVTWAAIALVWSLVVPPPVAPAPAAVPVPGDQDQSGPGGRPG